VHPQGVNDVCDPCGELYAGLGDLVAVVDDQIVVRCCSLSDFSDLSKSDVGPASLGSSGSPV